MFGKTFESYDFDNSYCWPNFFVPCQLGNQNFNNNLGFFPLHPSLGVVIFDSNHHANTSSILKQEIKIQSGIQGVRALDIPVNKAIIKEEPIEQQKEYRKKSGKRQSRPHMSLQLENIKGFQKDRNILSNSLKLVFKSLRNILRKDSSLYDNINTKVGLNYPLQKFQQNLNKYCPVNINYIRPSFIKSLFIQQDQQFSLMLKILVKKFYKETIYLQSKKMTPIKKKIQVQHIKAGRKLLEYFFINEQESEIQSQKNSRNSN